MLKTIIFLQTCLLCSVATLTAQFNVSLLFPSHLKVANETNMLFSESSNGRKANDLVFNNQLRTTAIKNPSVLRTVVIDAGHGGHDPGCLGAHSHEKDIALAIAKQLAIALRTAHPTLKVILTRDKDVFIPLHKRAAIANRNKADLFISIHCNAMPPGNARTSGTETYVMGLHTAKHNLNVAKRENSSILLEANYEKNYDYDPNSPEGHIILSMFQNAFLTQSILFAEKIEQQFKIQTKRTSRGVKQAGFVVLKETTMPSVLIEAGFLTNKSEENYLRTAKGQKAVVGAISKAFTEYKLAVENGNQTNVVTSTARNKEEPTPKLVVEKEPVRTYSHYRTSANPPPTTTPKSPTASRKKPIYKAPIVFYENEKENSSYKTYPGTKSNSSNTKPTYDLPSAYAKGKPITTKKSPQETNTYTNTDKTIQYRVQLAASPNLINTMTPKWQNIGYQIEIIAENNLYKYQARNFVDYQEASQAKTKLRSTGFGEAFVVAYRNGKRISLVDIKK